ncbi:Cof family hydrolase subfamily protein [Toxoplasma gondii RUB]|uniref:Cof family hydrolase subfamily protein n=10 Tax=Toxoplasma gondii TaxID=5811 RepID=S7WBL9_TOXGG|nr:Cof family hydrolase subfamily protein [Toxoplasma gondii GT1]KAF4641596.1 Cof family hydrolase subfamily protein [Toxoplasma gondii]KFG28822.1 Cof family hydrolase subfamily protein [Toxoplasma gondii GAB2-2007-GAL-DOM2]KFG50678.1 Cof family hydrolase subfamily protein [Toxoplasma gondii p89]KFG55606.1 Cof family hydrolase subfamily protein [Toxoplasma gondii FOU]KFG63484.1 Cof family hydrolase subfamily protein [Toxoplasma gondii RUB]KFH03018.1 Cof family hydrolase subfamily protein [Tox
MMSALTEMMARYYNKTDASEGLSKTKLAETKLDGKTGTALLRNRSLRRLDQACLTKHHPVKMILTDMDGTFLNSLHAASKPNVEAFANLRRCGIVGVIATGRPRQSVISGIGLPTFQRMMNNAAGPGIFMNGSVVYGPDGKIIFERHIDAESLHTVLSTVEQLGWRSRVCGYNSQGIYCEEKNEVNWRLHIEYGEPEPELVPEGTLDQMKFSKLIINGTDPEIDDLRPSLEHKLPAGAKCVRPLTWNLEVIPTGISKAVGMKVLLDHYGLSSNSVLTMGDSENDIEMFRASGISVAVNNASGIAKQAACYETVSNDDHAFAEVVTMLCCSPQD